MRRLPVYLLLDISGSMRGEKIEAVNEGIKILVETLRRDPYALETVYLSIIPFNDQVNQTMPLEELYKFQIPTLTAHHGTLVGKALKYLSAKAEEEVVKTTRDQKGGWKPLACIMSDGRAGDKISYAMDQFNKKQFGCIVVCAAGKDANVNALRLISDNLIRLENLDRESITSYFKWISASVARSSVKINENHTEVSSLNELPVPPANITIDYK